MNIDKVIKKYLRSKYPINKDLGNIWGNYGMRFELGGKLKNGTQERVKQAVFRATEIYKQSVGFGNVLVFCKHYEGGFMGGKLSHKSYLEELLNSYEMEKREGTFSTTITHENIDGKTVKLDKTYEFKESSIKALSLGIVKVEEPLVLKLLEGKANEEMGFEPCISEDITFFCADKEVGFRMYDDRGCDVWAKEIGHLKRLYENLNDWILDYNRPEIDKMFIENEKKA